MADMARFFFCDDVQYEEPAKARFLTSETKPILESFYKGFLHLSSLDETEQKRLIEDLAREYSKKVVDIIQPIRVALSGKTVSPGIFEVVGILGRESVERRVKTAIQSIE